MKCSLKSMLSDLPITIYSVVMMVALFGCQADNSSKGDDENVDIAQSLPYKSPADMGIDTTILNALNQKIIDQFYPNIHSILVAKDGWLIFEKYYEGMDENYGRELDMVMHFDSLKHDLRSITKSVVSACMGIAVKQGIVAGVDQKVAEFFPEITFEKEKATWTIAHFLTMTTGLKWNEDIPYDNPENSEIQMTYSEDPVSFVLSQPLDTLPGTTFNYSGGATQVLAEIIERASGKTIAEFANDHLFIPLGIEDFEWNKYAVWDGADEYAAPSGLRLTSRDLMKFAFLYRAKGHWNGEAILSEDWTTESFFPKIEFPSNVADGNEGYGYQYWIWPDFALGKEIRMVSAIGNGGQHIFWDLENDLMVVTTAGNYNQWDIENRPYSMLKNHIYPALEAMNANP